MQTTLGERMRLARTRAGMEQGEVADALGTDRSRVSEWERDKAIPEGRFLLKLPEILQVSADWLFYEKMPEGVAIPPREALENLRRWMDEVLPPRVVDDPGPKRKRGGGGD